MVVEVVGHLRQSLELRHHPERLDEDCLLARCSSVDWYGQTKDLRAYRDPDTPSDHANYEQDGMRASCKQARSTA